MKKLLLYFFISASLFASTQSIQAQTAPVKQWDKVYGGNHLDELTTMEQTTDGGYILGGWSYSGISSDKSSPSRGYADYWIIKIGESGIKQWDKTFGGTGNDQLYSIQLTSDGGYVLAGTSESNSNVDKSQNSKGSYDYWIIKLDSLGNKQWDKTYGGAGFEVGIKIIQTFDGGYVVGGWSPSLISGDKTQTTYGNEDYWILKLDSMGQKIWDKSYGGSSNDYFRDIIQTTDGGFIMLGESYSQANGVKSEPSKGQRDIWVIRTDATGNIVWDKSVGGSFEDEGYNIYQDSNKDFFIGARSKSQISGDKSDSCRGGYDYWIIKTDSVGNKIWDQTFGGSGNDYFNSIKPGLNGGLIVVGSSESPISGDKTQNSFGYRDYWLIRTDSAGNKIWDKTLGGDNEDFPFVLVESLHGGYLIGGYSYSTISGTKSQPAKGRSDYWIVKLGPEIVGLPEAQTTYLTLYPNPATGLINLELKDQQPTQISVYNSLGQTILTKSEAQPNPDGKLQLDLSNQAKGIYTVQVISGNRSAVKKVVLQ